MGAIDDAINAIESLDPGELFSYRKIAATYNVNRTTLSRRHKRVQATNEAKKINQQKLNPQQEQELVRYIKDLTERHIPPTREIVQNFALGIA
jgi:DNA-binding transcriptional regulator YhcF (GntR family)